jgi:AraC-like DNA-binding protein
VPLPTDDRLRAIADALLADPPDQRDLAVWAHAANSSVRTVTRLFADETGMTRNPARWLGLAGRLGEIRRGAQADLSFVAGDPLTDIRAAAAVRMVMTGGKLHTVDEP